MASALTSPLIAHITHRPSDIATTVLATEQTATEQIEHSIGALITRPPTHGRLTGALTSLKVARVQRSHCSIYEAIALLTALGIRNGQIPVQRFALITNATRRSALALTQLAQRYRPTASEPRGYSRRIAITLFAGGIIVISFFALLTVLPIEIVVTETLSLGITRHSRGSVQVTAARQTLGILIITGTAQVTLTTGEIAQAVALSTRIASRRSTTSR